MLQRPTGKSYTSAVNFHIAILPNNNLMLTLGWLIQLRGIRKRKLSADETLFILSLVIQGSEKLPMHSYIASVLRTGCSSFSLNINENLPNFCLCKTKIVRADNGRTGGLEKP